MDKNIELRFIPAAEIYNLSRVLDDGGWKAVMAIIPSNPSDMASDPKYTVEDIRLVESFGKIHSKSCTEILLDEWGTSGRVRPTLETLKSVLVRANFFRCADDIAQLLNENPPERPTTGPAANVNVELQSLTKSLDLTIINKIGSDDSKIISVSYDILFELTGGFNDEPLIRQVLPHGEVIYAGNKLGAGAFGTVYYGVLPDKREVAVKRLHAEVEGFEKQFETEVTILANMRHPNLLPLVAYSCNSDHYCLVYAFMPNRSLEDKLADKNNSLSWESRLEIAVGVCRGLHYLHTANPSIVHRDVKSANILLDASMNPRLGDFGLVRQTKDQKTMKTSTVIGTSAYMAPEAYSGNISVKMDVYSLGIVLLELLTGLPAYDETREGGDILSLVEESDEIEPLLDNGAKWIIASALKVFDISKKCVLRKKDRPDVELVLQSLSLLMENTSEA